MNQILSVEMPQQKPRKMSNGNKKMNLKAVSTIFSIVLIIFGISLIGIGGYSLLSGGTTNAESHSKDSNSLGPTMSDEPRIDIVQNGEEIEIEISSDTYISNIQYKWNNREMVEQEVDNKKEISFNLEIPSQSSNTFYIKVKDVSGKESVFTDEYVGPTAPKVNLEFKDSKLFVQCKEEQKIKNLIYYYDKDETQAKTIEVNNTTADVPIDIMQGKHDLTIKLEYEDGSTRKKTNIVYFPTVERVKVPADRSSFILRAYDERKISRVTMNFNGVDLPEEQVNNETFEKTLKLIEGENRLILTVYNSDGVSITTRTKYVKK